MNQKANILSRIFGQSDCLPQEIVKRIEAETGEKVQIYALCDLQPDYKFAETWLVVTESHLIQARPESTEQANQIELRMIPLVKIDKLELLEGFTLNRLYVVGVEQEKLLLSAFFTRRQIRAIGNLTFVVEQKMQRLRSTKEDRELRETLDATEQYQESIIQTVRDAKGGVILRQNIFRRLLNYLKPHKKAMFLGFAASFVLMLLGLLPPYITRVFLDDILKPAETGLLQKPIFWTWIIIGSLAFIWIGSQLADMVRLRVLAILGEKVATRLRGDLYQHLQRLSLSFYNQRSTGSIISRVTSDTDRLWDFLTIGVIEFVIAVITLIGVAFALFLQDARLAAIVVIPLPLMMYLFYRHSRTIHGMYLRIWRKWSGMTSVLSDVIPGIRVVRAFAQEDFEIERFQQRNTAFRDEAFALHRNWTTFWPGMVMLMHLSSFIVWAFGAPAVLRYVQTGGQEGMPLGVFIAFTGYMWMFWSPVREIGMMTRTFNRATSSASRIFEILDTAPAIVSKPKALKLEPLQGHIVFDNVTFSYDGVRNVLKGVSFEAFPGEMIGLVGKSGSGKSTLVNLICRFYDVDDGCILIDGHNIRDLDLRTLRRQVGMVLQEPYLFHGSIAENVAYGNPGATLNDIIEAARAANAHEFICGLPDAYDSMVGERGLMLSGGERQRISIARAILHNPRLLILDEATSSVDTETEKKIQQALHRLVSGRTTFAIAHRLSTLSSASRLFVMQDGRLIEQGTHQELLSMDDGVYSNLHNTQAELQAMIAI